MTAINGLELARAEGEIAQLPSRGVILKLAAGAAIVAFFILFAGVLPVEYGRDPLGLGRLTGVSALWAPPEKVAAAAGGQAQTTYLSATPFRSDVIDIPLEGQGDIMLRDQVEYKVRLPKGGTMVYSWSATGVDAKDIYSEFHGETMAADKSLTVAYYHKMTGISDNGTFIAPFNGIHGWYFKNSAKKLAKVRVRLSGFYTLVPDGEPGNEAWLHAKEVKAPLGE
jgi:hypothetical protein